MLFFWISQKNHVPVLLYEIYILHTDSFPQDSFVLHDLISIALNYIHYI